MITHPCIETYAILASTPQGAALDRVMQQTASDLDGAPMLSGPLVAGLLKILIQATGAARVLDIGTYTGYSAIAMAEALGTQGHITSYEIADTAYEQALQNIQHSGYQDRITLIHGDALAHLSTIGADIDFIYLDADKRHTQAYYDRLLPMMRPGAMMVIDDVLWHGAVLDPKNDRARLMDEFNEHLSQDDRVDNVLLPVRHGIQLIRKRN